MKRLLLRADDLGYSEAVNYGIRAAVTDGVIRNVGLMPNMESARHGVELLKGSDIALGQHTNISAGRPLCDPADLPSLVNKDGFFKSSRQYQQAGRDPVVIREAELEIEAQYRKFVELTGKEPDYFEGHAVFSQNYFTALEHVAQKHGLKYSGFSFEGKPVKIGRTMVENAFVPMTQEDYNPKQYLRDVIDQAQDETVYLCVFHPGYVDAYLMEHSSLTLNRARDVQMLCDSEVKSWIKTEKLQLIDYRQL